MPLPAVARTLLRLASVALAATCLSASTASTIPALPAGNEWVTIEYDPAGGPLADRSTVFLHRAINGWSQIAGPDQAMIWDASSGRFRFRYRVPEAAYRIDCVFHDGAGTWDNNAWQDWHFPVAAAPIPPHLPPPPALPSSSSHSGVMMQGFYWDVPPGEWYDLLASKAAELRQMAHGEGIERIWFPPPSKAQSGPHSMGYDPYDYYDLGQYEQKGTIRTRFGTQQALRAAIAAYRDQGIVCLADIVLNHRSGGDWEVNPLTGTGGWTDFSKVASGQCRWDHEDFHPSVHAVGDEGVFADFPDVCYAHAAGPGDPAIDLVAWGNWLRDPANAGFDGGWRFDYVKGLPPAILRRFRASTGNAFGILECWDALPAIEAQLRYAAGASAFDFPLYYTMRDVFNTPTGDQSVARLVDPDHALAARRPDRAVTFVANHDTDEIARNRMLAYAFILTYEGYPCLFWKDYFDRGYRDLGGQTGNGIAPLVWVRGALGGGNPKLELLEAQDDDLLVYGVRRGTIEAPGYLFALNDHPTEARSVTVRSSNPALQGRPLRAYAWYAYASGQNIEPAPVQMAGDGTVQLQVPARGYVAYGPAHTAYLVWNGGSTSHPEPPVLEVRGTRSGESYRVLTGDDPTQPANWTTALEITGEADGNTTLPVLPITDHARFYRVEHRPD